MSSIKSFPTSSSSHRPKPLNSDARAQYMQQHLTRRREAQQMHQDYWTKAVNGYFNQQLNCHQFDSIVNNQTSFNNFVMKREQESHKRSLEDRRHRLKQLLMKEQKELEAELKLLPPNKALPPSLEELRDARSQLREKRSQQNQREAQQRLALHQQINDTNYREAELKKRLLSVRKAWDEEVEQRKQQAMIKEQEEREQEAERIRQLQIQRQEEEAKEAERRREVEQWKNDINAQIEALRLKRREIEVLKQKEAEALDKAMEIEAIEKQREKQEEQRRKQQFKTYLEGQSKLHLAARSARIEAELEEDQRLLKTLGDIEMWEEERKADEINRKREELQWLIKVLEEQREEELGRRRAFSFLFSEDAKGIWKRQEKIWREEAEARKKLVDDVIRSWKQQIEQKKNATQSDLGVREEERMLLEQSVKQMNDQLQTEERRLNATKALKVEALRDINYIDGGVDNEEDKKKARPIENVPDGERQNEIAAKLAQFDEQCNNLPVFPDFRRRRARWF